MSENGDSLIELSDSDSDESVITISSDSESAASDELIFLDLTYTEIVESVDHKSPNASSVELARISEAIVQSSLSEEDDKVGNTANVTIRKRNRFTAFNNSTRSQRDTAVLRPLSSPIRRLMDESIANDQEKFIESLNDDVPIDQVDPKSHKFIENFKENKSKLLEKLFCLFNERVFDSKLNRDIVTFKWSKWQGKAFSAGICSYRTRLGQRCAEIHLTESILISAQRVRDTFLHELCHAAVWIIDESNNGHGDLWQSWVQKAAKAFPQMPLVTVYHNYENTYDYMYKCVICTASSVTNHLLDSEKLFCAFCHGPVEVLQNKLKEDGTRSLVPVKMKFGFAQFVKEKYGQIKKSEPTTTHAEILQQLSEGFSELSLTQKSKYRKSFANLKF